MKQCFLFLCWGGFNRVFIICFLYRTGRRDSGGKGGGGCGDKECSGVYERPARRERGVDDRVTRPCDV